MNKTSLSKICIYFIRIPKISIHPIFYKIGRLILRLEKCTFIFVEINFEIFSFLDEFCGQVKIEIKND